MPGIKMLDINAPSRLFKTLTVCAITALTSFGISPAGFSTGAAQAATSSLRVVYAVRITGVRVGTATLLATLEDGRYVAQLQGRSSVFGRLVSQGSGEALARGAFGGTLPVPTSFDLNLDDEGEANIVRMRLSGGDVQELSVDPEPDEREDRIELTGQHQRDVVDPVSAFLMPVETAADATQPQACNRTIPVLDGRQRFDLALSFVRAQEIASGNGTAIVCNMRYRPIAGHRANRRVNTRLAENPNMFIWLTQIGDSTVMAPTRMSIQLGIGTLSIEAIEFQAW